MFYLFLFHILLLHVWLRPRAFSISCACCIRIGVVGAGSKDWKSFLRFIDNFCPFSYTRIVTNILECNRNVNSGLRQALPCRMGMGGCVHRNINDMPLPTYLFAIHFYDIFKRYTLGELGCIRVSLQSYEWHRQKHTTPSVSCINVCG